VITFGWNRRSPSPEYADKTRQRFPWLELIWADGGYNAGQVEAAVAKLPVLRMEIVKRSDDVKGFVVLPRRWVVERTLSWFGPNRRLAKDFENLAENPGHLRYPRLHPACLQAACQGGGCELNKLPVCNARWWGSAKGR
jgi:transposase